jgi:glycosyltransferase involved in cell wall biosynthesis
MFSWLEQLVIRRSRVVIVICPHLEETVRSIDSAVPVVLIENAPGSGDAPSAGSGASLRSELGLPVDAPVVLYTGTFESYQGLDLLLQAAGRVASVRPDVRFVLAGGRPEQISTLRELAARHGGSGALVFAGQRPAEEIPRFLDAADVLVSPRSTGTNTPLKIYQYLRSGRPIVATRLLTHTQVLTDDIAILTDPTAAAFAEGILSALSDPMRARAMGDRARGVAETKYSYEAYLAHTRRACGFLDGNRAPQAAGGLA